MMLATRRLRIALVLMLGSIALPAMAASLPTNGSANLIPPSRTVRVAETKLKMAGATPQQAEWLKAFDARSESFEAVLREQPTSAEDGYRMMTATYPSPVKTVWPENNVVPAELYLPRSSVGNPNPARGPAAVVLDILDGSAVVPRALARGLAQQGVVALYMPMALYGVRRPPGNVHVQYYAEHPEETPDNIRQTVMDVRRAKALLSSLPEVDPDRVGITGVSLGGIMTSLAAGVDGTFHRVVPILAGGDLAAITFHARETRHLRAACEAKGITQPMLADILRPVEPLSFASRIDPAGCLMFNASEDEVIPGETTQALAQAIGAKNRVMVPAGHYRAVLFLPAIRERAIEFLRDRPAPK